MENQEVETQSKTSWNWIGIVVSLVIFAGVVIVLFGEEDYADVSRSKAAPPLPPVTVEQIAPARMIAAISAQAEVKPRWLTEVRAPVAGRVVAVDENAMAGTRVENKAILVSVEKTAYQTAVADAEKQLAEARFSLVQAQNKTKLAERQLKRAGIKKPNELVRHIPERRIAERAVKAAEAQLRAARKQLSDTSIRAPFAGLVTERMISLGQTVSIGEPLVRLADDRRFEMKVELGRADWELLDHPVAGKSADLFDANGNLAGKAVIRQGGGFLDDKTRQYKLYLEVDNANGTILGGDFLRVSLPGRKIANALDIPETALTRAGYIWLVDDQGRLDRLLPNILYRKGARIIMAAPDGFAGGQVAVTPLASFLPGQQVAPRIQGE